MLAYRFRFHGHASFNFLYRFGKTYRTRLFTLRIVSNPRRANNRYAVVVAKKVLKASPDRNRARRRIYEILRKNSAAMSPGYDVVTTVSSKDILTVPHAELEKLILDNLRQAQVL
ncbi:MAG TPA: ribonuclease P protein component [Patescibacteria group bacterium]|jgi:ribonuclease P protein component|nr:ribonuclease P protein component [Patescibacteria group bacterium]